MYKLVDGTYELYESEQQPKYKAEVLLSGEDIENIIVTALEGGINYWAWLNNETPEWKLKPDKMPVSQYATMLLLEGKHIIIGELEESETKTKRLTLRKLLKGFSLNMTHRPHDADKDNMDAHSADCIIQYALFGDVVYN